MALTHQNPRRRLRAFTICLATVATVGLPTVSLAGAMEPSADSAARSNVATRWVTRMLDAVRSGNLAIHTSTPGAARTYAMTTLAMYDAVNGIESAAGRSTRDRAIVPSYAAAPASGDPRAAANAAAHAVLSSLFSDHSVVKDRVDRAHSDELGALGPDQSVEIGRAWGAWVGHQALQVRAGDGSQTSLPPEPGRSGPGMFPRSFTGTQFGDMATFGIVATDPYRSGGPPQLTSQAYADAFNEVKELGSADADPERRAIARQWLAEGGTVRETGLWFKAAVSVAQGQGTVSSLSDTVRLFGLLGMGVADAVAVSWSDKLAWYYWRPGDAIRQAGSDGNPATEPDPTWNPRNGTCSTTSLSTCGVFGGTPEHTSGTSTFAGAAAAVLSHFYCRDAVGFSFVGEQAGSTPRTYSSFSQAAREAGRSRIYGGIHFQFSNDAGRAAGKGIGQEIVRIRLLPAGTGPASSDVCKRNTSN